MSENEADKKESLLILWLGINEYEEFNGTIAEAVASIKSNRRYADYGRSGAIIVRATELYRIGDDGIETGVIE